MILCANLSNKLLFNYHKESKFILPRENLVQDVTKGLAVKADVIERSLKIGTASNPIVFLGCVNPNNLTDIANVAGWVC